MCIIILYSRHCRVRFFFFSLVWVDDFFKTALHKLVSQQLIWDSNPFSSLICMTLLLSVLHLLIIKFNCRLLKFLFVRFGLPILIRCCIEHLRSNFFKQNQQYEIKNHFVSFKEVAKTQCIEIVSH